jgi:SAM-dependent methyltransferase
MQTQRPRPPRSIGPSTIPAAVFGEARLLPHTSLAERLLFRLMGLLDPAHWLHMRYFRQTLDWWTELAPCRILDAGSGRGDFAIYLARRFPAAQVIGLDIDPACVERSRAIAAQLGLTNLAFQAGDLVTAAFDEPFDLVISIDVLEHIVEQEAAIRNLRQHLAPGGKYFFHVPTVRERPVLFSAHLQSLHAWAEGEHLAEERWPEEFIGVVRQAGFSVDRAVRTFGRYTGELSVSLFSLPHRQTRLNRVLQGLLAPACRLAAWADGLHLDRTRYAVAVSGGRGRPGHPPAGRP